jgi:hypothetical protein
VGTARAAAISPPPVDSTTFPDFSLIKINSDDDSLAKIQKKVWLSGRRTIGRTRFSSRKRTNGPDWTVILSNSSAKC